jgi:outer membrane protein assembly factor BamB
MLSPANLASTSTGTRRRYLACVASLGCAVFLAAAARAEDWPGWRGPKGTGHSSEKNLPLTWGGKNDENVLWKIPLGGVGNSSPIVWGGRVLVTTSARQSREEEAKKIVPAHHVACYAAEDGKLLWRTSVPPGQFPEGYEIYAVPTPVTDGARVFAWFGSGVFAALDLKGKLLWRKEYPPPFRLNPGICSSPVLYRDTVLLLLDQGGGAGFLRALDKDTGEVKWEHKRAKVSYSNATPLLIQVAGKDELIIAASNALQGLDPATGRLRWWCTASGFGSSPVYASGLIYSDSGTNGAALAVEPGGEGDVTKTRVKWKLPKVPAAYSSAIIWGDYVYRTHRPGVLTCRRLSTGEEVFSERLEEVSELASPFATPDGRIYFASTSKSYVIQAGPKLEVLATNVLKGGRTGASAAVSNGRIFLRDRQFLYCIGKKE